MWLNQLRYHNPQIYEDDTMEIPIPVQLTIAADPEHEIIQKFKEKYGL
jgi:hypothetical protein